MQITFWGVRGSIAVAAKSHRRYGGNTPCVHVSAGGQEIVFDSGTGIRPLGVELLRRDVRHATLMLSHTHWDHIQGFPFFAPAFDPNRTLRILAGHLPKGSGIRTVLAGQMAQPTFPVPLEIMRGSLTFEDFVAGDTFSLGEVKVRTAPLNHPNGATGYRLEHAGASMAYVTDTEHTPGKLDQNIIDLIEGCDLFIYDCTYTDEEFPSKVGWGHSTWQEAVRLSRAAKVRRLAIFHHDPDHDDSFMGKVEKEAHAMFRSSFVAREGMCITLRGKRAQRTADHEGATPRKKPRSR